MQLRYDSLVLGCLGIFTVGVFAAAIPESEIAALEQALVQEGGQDTSAVSARRTLKTAVRKGLALLETEPEAANRLDVLGIVFQCQKQLLSVDNIEQNRTALFDTCEMLTKAPDTYAALRLEADLLLSDRDLSARNATLGERAEALAALIERYRGTEAEARSLLMGALIVQKLDAPELENAILDALDENFPDDAEVIEFRSRHLKAGRLDVIFKGDFERIDGTTLRFPIDTSGHMCLMVFWSRNKPGYEAYLERTKEALAPFAGLMDVFSFNVDELPDGGESILHERGLDWAVMHLPGGRNHSAYRTYAQNDPVSVLVNEYGFSVIRPEIVHGRMNSLDPVRISEARYSTQLQSLFIGDFLLPEQAPSTPPPTPMQQAIRDAFVMPPFRYRLSRKDALSNYTQAAALCAEAISRPDLAEADRIAVRNRRIIALLGMWNLAVEPAHLDAAVTEAKAVLALDLPAGADVVPRFCHAKAALRDATRDEASVVTRFLEDCGGTNAPASALAAAAILALDARSKALHEHYRGIFLENHAEDPALYTFTSFLRDRHHLYRLLKANYTRAESHTRHHIVAFGQPAQTNRLPEIELRTLDGSPYVLPKETSGKLTYLLFVEPPADPKADFPVVLDSRGNATKNDCIRRVIHDAEGLTASHVNKDINFVAAFLTDNANQVRFLMETNAWNCQAVIVPGGLKNQMVRQLGILSADRIPNVFVLRRDGSIAWNSSGLPYQTEFGFPFAFLLAMKVHVEACEAETGYEALARGDYPEAVRLFSGPFPPGESDRYGWLSPRYHGQARGYMGMKNGEAALDAIDKAIDAHKLQHFRGRRSRPSDWRIDAATVVMQEPCDTLATLWMEKAAILEQLGRKEEADDLRKLCEQPITPHRPNPYNTFHEQLNKSLKHF